MAARRMAVPVHEVPVAPQRLARFRRRVRPVEGDARGGLDHGRAVVVRPPLVPGRLEVVAHGGDEGVRGPVEHHRREQVVLREARLHVAAGIAPVAPPFENPGAEADGRIVRHEGQRLRVERLHGHVRGVEPHARQLRPSRLARGQRRQPRVAEHPGPVVAEQVQPDRVREVDADHVLRVAVAQLAGDERAPVAALRAVALVAQHAAHERVPEVRRAPEVDAGHGQRRGEAEARQRGHDHVEGVGGIAAVGRGVAEGADHVAQVPEGPRPAVREDERDRVRPPPAHVDEVDGRALDLDAEVGQAVHLRLVRAPVVTLEPVFGELTQVGAVHAVGPAVVGEVGRPVDALQPPAQVGQLRVGDGDGEGLGVHRDSSGGGSAHSRT